MVELAKPLRSYTNSKETTSLCANQVSDTDQVSELSNDCSFFQHMQEALLWFQTWATNGSLQWHWLQTGEEFLNFSNKLVQSVESGCVSIATLLLTDWAIFV